MESLPITFELQHTSADLLRLTLKVKLKRILTTAFLILGGLFLLYAVSSHYLVEPLSDEFRIILVIFFVGIPLASVLINLIGVARATHKWAAQGPYTFSADAEGVSYSEPGKSATQDWSAYTFGIELKDKFILKSNSGGGLLLPKRCFTSEEQIAAFRELAIEGMEGRFKIMMRPPPSRSIQALIIIAFAVTTSRAQSVRYLYWYDDYVSVTPTEEKYHLDSFGIYLNDHPEMDGYIAFSVGRGAKGSQVRGRAVRAREYMVRESKIRQGRLHVIAIVLEVDKTVFILQPIKRGQKFPASPGLLHL